MTDTASALSMFHAPRAEVLIASARAAHAGMQHHLRLAAESAVAAGAALAEARSLRSVERWAGWVREAGLPADAVALLLGLHDAALDAEAVTALGGVIPAAEWASRLRLPEPGEVVVASLEPADPCEEPAAAFVWRAADGLCAATLPGTDPLGRPRATRCPLGTPRRLWGSVWHLLGPRHPEIAVLRSRDGAEAVIAELDAHRLSLLATGATRAH